MHQHIIVTYIMLLADCEVSICIHRKDNKVRLEVAMQCYIIACSTGFSVRSVENRESVINYIIAKTINFFGC